MMLPRSPKTRNRISVLLLIYCIIMLYHLGLFSKPFTNPQKTAEKVKAPPRTRDLTERKSKTQSYSKLLTPAAFKIQQESLKESRPEEQYEHLLNPEFPLPGPLKSPKPRHKLGSLRKNADVIIGITTVMRTKGDYLLDTIDSLLLNRESSEKSIKIVVFIGETNITYVQERSKEIHNKFRKEIDVGELEVISPPENYYPNWDIAIEVTLNDTLDRVKWRSKQNLDQIFIMMYIYNLFPEYYLMMEDDVISKKGYDRKIFQAVKHRDHLDWFLISFCGLGAIGKLFHNPTLPSYASFIHTFWNKQPLDWLQINYVESAYCSHDSDRKTCVSTRHKKMPAVLPSVFQHVGKFSSLQGKVQELKDKSFNLRQFVS